MVVVVVRDAEQANFEERGYKLRAAHALSTLTKAMIAARNFPARAP